MDLTGLIAEVGGATAILSTVVGVTIYVTKLRCDIARSRVEDTLNRLREQHAGLEMQYRTLLNAGSVAYTRKTEIDAQLSTIGDAVEAEGCSILVPAPSLTLHEQAQGMVFLSLRGTGSENLKRLRVSMDTVAGTVFKGAKPIITHDLRRDSEFANKAAKVTQTSTSELMALPLPYQGRCVGVVEFLNKRANRQFDFSDQKAAERLLSSLALKVGEFVEDPSNFELLGITPRRPAETAAVLFTDVSGSSRLAKHLDASVFIDLINEYFELLCDAVLAHGGTINQFLGDGFMASFNVPKPVPQPERKAVEAALEMQKRFESLNRKWTAVADLELFNRIGIAFGPVHRAEMGHTQFRYITVFGDVVNTASNLCSLGPRSRNVILVDDGLRDSLSSNLVGQEFRPAPLKELKGGLSTAFEITSLK
jgi:class 3 adenylate cyclase